MDEVFEGCVEHLRYSTNGGSLRAVLSVFPATRKGYRAFTIQNPQLVRYAGFRQSDGSVVGDPLHVEVTDQALGLGWRPQEIGPFEILPLLITDPRGRTTYRVLPDDAVLEVPITSARYPDLAELNLRWHANPAICDKVLALGGVRYPLAPFSGWYVSSEIGARNLGDEARYNMLPAVARIMGVDTRPDSSFWRDKAVVELTHAVDESFRRAGVHVIDHHRAARQFIAHCEREAEAGRRTPTDWSWVNPPISASTTPTFHRTFDPPDFSLLPNFIER